MLNLTSSENQQVDATLSEAADRSRDCILVQDEKENVIKPGKGCHWRMVNETHIITVYDCMTQGIVSITHFFSIQCILVVPLNFMLLKLMARYVFDAFRTIDSYTGVTY